MMAASHGTTPGECILWPQAATTTGKAKSKKQKANAKAKRPDWVYKTIPQRRW